MTKRELSAHLEQEISSALGYKDGKLTEDSKQNWTTYSDGPKRIIFHNGKLSSFYANRQYWDRMDNPTDAPVVQIKEGNVTRKVELVPYNKDGVTKIEEF